MNSIAIGAHPKKWRVLYQCITKTITLTALFFLMAQSSFGAGLTIITHGFQPFAGLLGKPAWVAAMGDQVARIANRSGGNTAVYEMDLVLSPTTLLPYVANFTLISGQPPSDDINSEVVIELYWDHISDSFNPLDPNTTQVAEAVVPFLTNPTSVPNIPRPLAEMPIHLIGHSRGASLVSEISRLLGQKGIWVHQLTTLDPHPVGSDAPTTSTWETVLYADNYYEEYLETIPDGQPIAGANYEILTERLPGGYGDDPGSGNHSDVHLWYFGTIDTDPNASNGELTMTDAMRASWYTTDELSGSHAGYYFSRLGGGQTDDNGPYFGMYNEGDFNNSPDNRASLAGRTSNEWPNLLQLAHDKAGSVTAGSAFPLMYVFQSRNSASTINIYLDADRNPYNGNVTELSIAPTPDQSATALGTRTIDASGTVPLSTPPGSYYLYAKITNPFGTRYLYSVNKVRVVANAGSTIPNITSVSPSSFTGKASPQTQLITVFGSGFTASSTLTFNDGVNSSYTGRVPIFVNSGELDYNIAVGTSQANWTVQVINGSQSSNIGVFTVAAPPPPSSGSLIVTLQPPDAVSVGAQWRIDSGPYHGSGDVVTGITPGIHTVSCKLVPGYVPPAQNSISIVGGSAFSDTENYTADVSATASLGVNINNAAVLAGAQWNVDGGIYHNSGETINNLKVGYHTIGFKDIPEFLTPATILAYLSGGTGYGVTYLPAFTISIDTFPGNSGLAIGAGKYYIGSYETISAMPNLNYAFVDWTENGTVVSEQQFYSFNLHGDRNLVANFRFWGPIYFNATAVSQSAVGLSWESFSNSRAFLIIEKTNENTGSFDVLTTLNYGITSWIDTNTIPNHEYSYRIRAWDGSATYSTYSEVTTKSTQPVSDQGSQCRLANGNANYWAIATDNNFVYWSSMLGEGNAENAIWKVSKSNGSITALATDLPYRVLAMAVRSNYLYWAESQWSQFGGPTPGPGAIRMIPISGGQITTITSNDTMGVGDGIRGLVVDDSGIYWCEDGSPIWDYTGQIRAVIGVPVDSPTALQQTTPIVLASNLFAPYTICADNTCIYWSEVDPFTAVTNRGAVKCVAKSGGPPTVLATNLAEVESLAVDATNVYFQTAYSVYKVTKTGGSTTFFANADSIVGIDANYLYVIIADQIRQLTKAGGVGPLIVSGLSQPWLAAIDTTGIYWTEEPTTLPRDGKIGMLGFFAPKITSQPFSQSVVLGTNITLAVTTIGTAPLTYQWRKDLTNIASATSPTYNIPSLLLNAAGNYSVIVSNPFGSAVSTGAVLIVLIPDTNSPIIKIANPLANARWSNSVITMSGTATDNVQIASVWCNVNGHLWNFANGTTNWAVNVQLDPGTNILQAYSMDTSNNRSTTNKLSIQFVVTNQVQIHKIGLGTILPNYNNALLEVGRNYAITSNPAGGFVFANWICSTNWTGGSTITGTNMLFMMASNLTLQATFTETSQPSLNISAPLANQHMTNALANLFGTASDKWGVAEVWCKVNSNLWTLVTTTNGFTNWNAMTELIVGTNKLKAYAVNLGGLYSTTGNVTIVSSNTFKLMLAFTNAAPLNANGLVFNLQLSTGLNGHIQVSSNLINWVNLVNFVGTNSTIKFRDPAATNSSHRFYRAVIP